MEIGIRPSPARRTFQYWRALSGAFASLISLSLLKKVMAMPAINRTQNRRESRGLFFQLSKYMIHVHSFPLRYGCCALSEADEEAASVETTVCAFGRKATPVWLTAMQNIFRKPAPSRPSTPIFSWWPFGSITLTGRWGMVMSLKAKSGIITSRAGTLSPVTPVDFDALPSPYLSHRPCALTVCGGNHLHLIAAVETADQVLAVQTHRGEQTAIIAHGRQVQLRETGDVRLALGI